MLVFVFSAAIAVMPNPITIANVINKANNFFIFFIIHSFFSGQGEGRKSGLETRGPPPPSETRLSDGRNYGPNPKGN